MHVQGKDDNVNFSAPSPAGTDTCIGPAFSDCVHFNSLSSPKLLQWSNQGLQQVVVLLPRISVLRVALRPRVDGFVPAVGLLFKGFPPCMDLSTDLDSLK